MILPTKGVPADKAIVSVGGEVLRVLTEAKTVSRLWDEFKGAGSSSSHVPFDWFLLALDFLYLVGAIEMDRGRVRRASAVTP